MLPNCVQVSEQYGGEQSQDTIRVVATSPVQSGNDTYQLIAYSFVGKAAHHATEIYWDPEAGISYSEGGSSSSVAWGLVGSSLRIVGSAFVISGMLFW